MSAEKNSNEILRRVPGKRVFLILALLLLFTCLIFAVPKIFRQPTPQPTDVAVISPTPGSDMTPAPTSTATELPPASTSTATELPPAPEPSDTVAPTPTSTRQPPTLSLPGDMTVEASGPTGAQAAFTASAHDPTDGGLPVDCEPPSGSTFPPGTSTVTCAASNSAGVTVSGSFRLTVQHTIPPGLALPDDMQLEATSPEGAVAAFAVTVSDTVDKANVTCDRPSGSTFPLGDTTVTCTATDEHQNQARGSFRVQVIDSTPPQVEQPRADQHPLYYGGGGCGPASTRVSVRVTDAVGVSSAVMSYRFASRQVTDIVDLSSVVIPLRSAPRQVTDTVDLGSVVIPRRAASRLTPTPRDPWLTEAMRYDADAGAWIATLVPGTDADAFLKGTRGQVAYQVVATDSAGNATTSPANSLDVYNCVFDFVKRASEASWSSGRNKLPFPGNETDTRGFALWWQNNKTMEDKSVPELALETHPQWVDNGSIRGSYTPNLLLQNGDRLRLKVGFVEGAGAGQAIFKVNVTLFRPGDDAGQRETLAAISHAYNGRLEEQMIDLSKYGGMTLSYFSLEVSADGTSAQDWATWIVAQIER